MLNDNEYRLTTSLHPHGIECHFANGPYEGDLAGLIRVRLNHPTPYEAVPSVGLAHEFASQTAAEYFILSFAIELVKFRQAGYFRG